VRLPRQPLLRSLLFAAAGALFFFGLTTLLSTYNNYELGEIAAYAIAIAGLSVLTGVTGQISLGHGGFMAVGAYTLAVLQTHTSLNLLVELVAAVALAAAAGLVIGIPATRLHGPYLAGMTLIFALSLPFLSEKYSNFLGGDQGLTATPPTPPGSIAPEKWLAWIQILGALIVLVLLSNLLRSRFGRSFKAVRDDEIAASLSGIHVARTKVIAFVVSAGCAGLAGALLGLSLGVVSTGEFPLSLSIYLLAGMVLGGAGSLVGAWWGAAIVVYLPNNWAPSLSKDFGFNQLVSANFAVIIFGLVLIVVMLAAPSGVQGLLWRLWGPVGRRLEQRLRPPSVANMTLALQESADSGRKGTEE